LNLFDLKKLPFQALNRKSSLKQVLKKRGGVYILQQKSTNEMRAKTLAKAKLENRRPKKDKRNETTQIIELNRSGLF